ncbi:sensor domain-containing diguanylate cyclase [Azonexus sp.]|uniref:sensor domain-containing diguanylate cyclase n=1 Tax=Azonexus sp. TaxID=1872668 RepID=UPI0027B9B975|nr:sensor domain-containing diguanylate cyclase [Azonexus sp.]
MPSHEQLLQVIRIQAEIAKLGLDLGGVMQYIVEQTLPLIDADGAVIELAEDGDMVYRAAAGIAEKQLGLRLKLDASLSGLSVISGETLVCNDSDSDPRVDRVACQKVGLRSMIVIPLKHHGITVGVLKAMSAQANKFSEQEMRLLAMLSEVVAASMYFSVKYDIDDLFLKATHDGMTGLANRALFMDRLRNTLTHTDRSQSCAGILMVDMDGLKQINDTFGHRVGDAVIVEFSNRIKTTARATDTVARLGGDEFGIILTPIENWDGIASAIQRIDADINREFIFENKEFRLNASIGAALVPGDGIEPEKVLEVADQRMYAEKQSRKTLTRTA